MLTVLLIDDEYMILKGMEAMLNNQREVPLRVVPFLDSVEALSKLAEIRPDVIVTDINMPELDGLTFMERAAENGFRGRFLIISGYEELTYFKRALALHAVEYLIKPIDKRKLIDTLGKLNAEREQAQRQLLLRFRLALTLNAAGGDDGMNADWLTLLPQPYALLLAIRTLPDETESALNAFLSGYFAPIHTFRHCDLSIWLLSAERPLTRTELQTLWESFPEGRDAGGGPGTTFVRVSVAGWSDAHSVAGLVSALVSGRSVPLLLEALERLLTQMLALGDITVDNGLAEDVLHPRDAATLEAAWKRALRDAASPKDGFAMGLLLTFAAEIAVSGLLPDANELCDWFIGARQGIIDASTLYSALWSLPADYSRLCAARKRNVYSEKIEQAIRYMKEHYTEDVSLGDVAAAVELSPNYFSTMFNREVGVSFLDYLHRLRMEASCRLLEANGSLSVEAVAQMVGYQSAGHFYKMFKDTYGISPNRWRKRCAGEKG